ncbi:MAG: DUF368 domain-containing protein [Clostridia bacterium]|nr:DUF368 domain-containing protein [Clostridia bacterium]
MINFFKGLATGLGAVAPGLSGSVLLVIFGLYRKTISALNELFRFKNIWKNIRFFLPLGLGIGIGAMLFGRLINFLLENFEMYTRFAFLGLILGTIPLFFKEVKKEGFSKKYYLLIIASLVFGIFIFFFNKDLFPNVENPAFLQSVLLGFSVAVSYIVPGIDSAAVLSALGFYELWVKILAHPFDYINLFIPVGLGAVLGIILISIIINKLIQKCYTATFSVIFGLFLSVIPSVLSDKCVIGLNASSGISLIILAFGFIASILFGNLEKLKKVT